jgi:hypothetical protein
VVRVHYRAPVRSRGWADVPDPFFIGRARTLVSAEEAVLASLPMRSLSHSPIRWKQLLPVIWLAIALVVSGTVIADGQPVAGKQGASFFAKVAADATASGFSKTDLTLHVAHAFVLAVPVVVLAVSATPVTTAFSPVLLAPARSRAPPIVLAFS